MSETRLEHLKKLLSGFDKPEIGCNLVLKPVIIDNQISYYTPYIEYKGNDYRLCGNTTYYNPDKTFSLDNVRSKKEEDMLRQRWSPDAKTPAKIGIATVNKLDAWIEYLTKIKKEEDEWIKERLESKQIALNKIKSYNVEMHGDKIENSGSIGKGYIYPLFPSKVISIRYEFSVASVSVKIEFDPYLAKNKEATGDRSYSILFNAVDEILQMTK